MADIEKIEMEVVGITYTQVSSGAYALLLREAHGKRRIPVVVGLAEAQAIAMRLEHVTPPRPISHDLMVSIMHAHGIILKEVVIYRFKDGVFLSELVMHDALGQETRIDSRTSDAVALAMRTGAPIYALAPVVQLAGFEIEELTTDGGTPKRPHAKLEDMSVEQLQKVLDRAVSKERYERAAQIQRLIERKLSEQPDNKAQHGNEE